MSNVLAVDFDRDGFSVEYLDSSLSHSHFFELGPPSVSGNILKQAWYMDNTNVMLNTKETVEAPFPFGLRLYG